MIKFRDLLFEDFDEFEKYEPDYNLSKIEDELNSGKWRLPEPEKLLYRGEGDKASDEVFGIKKIRKDRNPRDTRPIIHVLIDGINRAKRHRAPLRKKSKFAGGARRADEMEKYGDVKVCFSEKDAKIYHLEDDSFTILKKVGKKLSYATFLGEEKAEEVSDEYPHFYKFFTFINKDIFFQDFPDYVAENYDFIYNEVEELATSMIDPDIRSSATAIKRTFQILEEEYFSELKRGVDPEAHEHIFDGDKYLFVDSPLFSENFKYQNNMWVLK